ncbi:MAG: hypothetical protein WCO25_02840 [Candidatus Uhrbacteria bacterium]
MYNWSTDEELLKNDPEAHAVWRLEQLVNFGLNDQKLSVAALRKYWDRLVIDPVRKSYLAFLLHG